MASEESLVMVQAEAVIREIEDRAVVEDLVRRTETLVLHDIPVLLAAYERVDAVRRRQDRHVSWRCMDVLERIGEQIEAAEQMVKSTIEEARR